MAETVIIYTSLKIAHDDVCKPKKQQPKEKKK